MSLAAFLDRLGDIPWSRSPAELKRKSKDYFWFSPVLAEQLQHCQADVILSPRSVDDVMRIAAASAVHGIALTPRGGGTGNYGQAVPLQGGAVIDMTGLSGLLDVGQGVARVAAGTTLFALEQALLARGHELRMFPSTWRTATVGGFVAGGTGGVGSVTWGGLREPGNLIGARLVTIETEPRLLTLSGSACNLINRTFGTTGLLVELELPVQAAVDWRDALITFDDYASALDFGAAFCGAKGIEKRLCSVSDERIVRFFRPFAPLVAPGRSIAGVMVAPAGLIGMRELAAAHGGQVVLERPTSESEQAAGLIPVYEIAFNHATQHVLKRERGHTYLQSLYPSADVLLSLRDRLGDEVMWHVEYIGFDGGHAMNGLPVLRYTDATRLAEVIAIHEEAGAPVANPHVFTVEDGSRYKRLSGDQLGFKHDVDPMGLLNPGKMRSFTPLVAA
jgi:FAD/FMN-containing dehydrogenase